jgi:alpha-glucuronidase
MRWWTTAALRLTWPVWLGLSATSVLLTASGAVSDGGFDPLWLRYPRVSAGERLSEYRSLLGTSALVVCEAGADCQDATSHLQLVAVADELQVALRGLLGVPAYNVSTGSAGGWRPAAGLVASVLGGDDAAATAALGKEGYQIRTQGDDSDGGGAAAEVRVEAASASGLLYGAFKLLSLLQQHKPIPRRYESGAGDGAQGVEPLG